MVTPVGMGIFGSFIQGQELENERRAKSLQALAQVVNMGGALQGQRHQAQMLPLQLQNIQAQIAERERRAGIPPTFPIGAGGLGIGDPNTPGGIRVIPPAQRPPAPNPFAGIHNVPGGYITDAPGNPFTRTQQEPPPPVSERVVQDPTSPTGWSYEDARTRARRQGAPPPAASARIEDKKEQRAAAADYAESLTARLRANLGTSPRSTTGLFSPVVRGFENVANAIAPGSVSSDATISAQSKEQLINVLNQARGGAYGRNSNQENQRIDRAIGQISSGTPDGMLQGLSDVEDLIDILRGQPARSTIGGPDKPPPSPGGKPRKPLSAFEGG